jgi:hypothetical protein
MNPIRVKLLQITPEFAGGEKPVAVRLPAAIRTPGPGVNLAVSQ